MARREFAITLVELLAALGAVTAKRMFGGFGLYLDGLMFALIADDVLYVKADAANRAAFEARAMPPFSTSGRQDGHHRLPRRPCRSPEDRNDLVIRARPVSPPL